MSIRNGLVFAMEDDTTLEDGVVTPEAAVEVEAGSAEVAQQTGEVEDLQAAIEDAEEGAETLEKIEGVLEESAESGEGVDETAAEIAEVAVESICARLGIRTSKSFPAMEAFGSQNSRLSATKIALENIGEHIKRIWEAIKAAFIRLWDKVKAFFNTMFKNVGGLAKQLEDLKERATKVPSAAKPKDAVLENKALAKAFSIAKKADVGTAKTLISNGTKLLDTAKSLAEGSTKFSAAIEKTAAEASSTGDLTKARNDLAGHVKNALGGLSTLASSHGEAGADAEKSEKYYGPFVGTRVLAVSESVREFAGDKIVSFGIGITTYDKIEADKITALKAEEVYELAKEGLVLAAKLKDFEKTQKELEKSAAAVRKSAEKATASMNKTAEAGEDAEKAKVLKSLTKDVSTVNSFISSAGVGIPSTVYATVKAVIDYGSISLRNLSAK